MGILHTKSLNFLITCNSDLSLKNYHTMAIAYKIVYFVPLWSHFYRYAVGIMKVWVFFANKCSMRCLKTTMLQNFSSTVWTFCLSLERNSPILSLLYSHVHLDLWEVATLATSHKIYLLLLFLYCTRIEQLETILFLNMQNLDCNVPDNVELPC